MVNWQDPTTLFLSSRAFVVMFHMFFGIYLLEFFQSLGFDVDCIFGRRHRWGVSTAIYFMARYTALAGLAVGIRAVNVLREIDCQTWMYAAYSLAYAGIAFSLALLYIRVADLAAWKLRVVGPLALPYCAYCALAVTGVIHVGAVAVPELLMCGPVLNSTHAGRRHNANTYLPLVAAAFALACLGLMATYLQYRGRRFVVSYLVYHGAHYVASIALANLVAGIFVLAPLNDAASQAPSVLAGVFTVICATRLQRDVFVDMSDGAEEGLTSQPIAFRGTDSGIELRVTIHVEQHAARDISFDVVRGTDQERKSKEDEDAKDEL